MAETAQARGDVGRAIRDAMIAGLVAFGILLPLIGLRTAVNIRNELILEPRPFLLAVLVGLVGARSLVVSRVGRAASQARAAARPEGESVKAAERRAAIAKYIVPFALGFAFL